jgi:hypothetical protein
MLGWAIAFLVVVDRRRARLWRDRGVAVEAAKLIFVVAVIWSPFRRSSD